MQGGGAGDGPQQGARAAGGVEHREGRGAGRSGGAGACTGGPGEGGHERGEAVRGERVLAGVGVEVAAEEELEGLAGAEFGAEFGGGPQQRHGGGAQRDLGERVARPQARAEHPVEDGPQPGGHALVGVGGQFRPVGGPVVYDEQRAAGLDECADGPAGVGGDLLPDALAQRDLGELSLGAQPVLHLTQGEGGAGLGTTDGLGEVGVAAAPVADCGAADSGQACDLGRGDLCGVLLGHAREHTPLRERDHFTP